MRCIRPGLPEPRLGRQLPDKTHRTGCIMITKPKRLTSKKPCESQEATLLGVSAAPIDAFAASPLDFQPRYARVAQALIEEIATGKHRLGGLISTESEICKKFGVSRNTARSALSVLCDMGLVTRHAGIGTVVRSLTAAPHYVQEAESVSGLFPSLVDATEQLKLSELDVRADASLSRLLECRRGDRWRQIESVRGVRQHKFPVSYSMIYLPQTLAHLSVHIDRLRSPTYMLIEQKSESRVAKMIHETSACPVAELASQRLSVETGSPGLQVIRRYLDEAGATLLVTNTIYPAGRYSFSFAIKLPRG